MVRGQGRSPWAATWTSTRFVDTPNAAWLCRLVRANTGFERSRLRPLPLARFTPKAAAAKQAPKPAAAKQAPKAAAAAAAATGMGGEGFEPPKAKPTDLQSVLVDHLSIRPKWVPRGEAGRRVYSRFENVANGLDRASTGVRGLGGRAF